MEVIESLSLHDRFKAAFDRLGLKQQEVGEIIGVVQTTVSNYLLGKSEPSEEQVQALEAHTPSGAEKKDADVLRELETLLWKIGSENPRSREIVRKMLEMNAKIRYLLN